MTTHRLPPVRQELGHLIETCKLIIVLEIVSVTALPFALVILRLPRTIIPLFFMGWVSLWLRGKGWDDVGLRRPASWLAAVVTGMTVAALVAVFGAMLVSPLLFRLTGEAEHRVVELSALRPSVPYFLMLLAAIWLLAAVGEEAVYRGYVFNRLIDIFGSGWTGQTVAVIISSMLFSLTHGSAERAVLLGGFLLGVLEVGLYLIARRNLWLPIVFHGVWDTIFLALAFMGLPVR